MSAPPSSAPPADVSTARDGGRGPGRDCDNGPGIPEAAAHILEPFYTTKPGTAW
jgi:C4-dicarboxylate-specific signal transduction histidine kinase